MVVITYNYSSIVRWVENQLANTLYNMYIYIYFCIHMLQHTQVLRVALVSLRKATA